MLSFYFCCNCVCIDVVKRASSDVVKGAVSSLDLLDSNTLDLPSKLRSIFSGMLSNHHTWNSTNVHNLSSPEDA